MAKSKSSGGLIFLILVILAAAGGTGYYYYKKTAAKEPEYSTVKVGRGNVVQSITATGTLTTTSQVTISSQVSGNVKKIGADFNEEVKKGQMLLEIDPTTYQQKLRQAEADLEASKANFEKVKSDTARVESLYKGGTTSFVTKQDYDNAIAQLASSKSQLISREAALENAKTDLERCIITSPIDGVVLNRTTDVGGTVNVNQSAVALFIIINDLSHLQISADVSEADIGNVKEGQPAFFTVDAYLNQRFNGSVSQVRNYAKNSSGVVTFSVIIDVDNSDRRLKPGMTASAGIIIAERANVLTVTNGALRAKIPAELQSKVIKADASAPAPAAMPAVAAAPAENPSVAMPGGQDQNGGRGRGGPGGGRGAGGGRRGNGTGQNSGIGMNVSNTPRLLYKVATDATGKKVPQEVRARLGISDGSTTEVVDGLAEGDEVITFVTMPGAAATITTAPTSTGSPFQQGGGGNRGGGGNFRGGF